MSVVPQDIHGVAVTLAEGQDEACWRSSLSRAYYAAYHACEAWHAQMPLPGSIINANGSHQRLCSQLRHPAPGSPQAASSKSKTLGAQLDVLRVRRKVADYVLHDAVDQTEARNIAAIASLMLQKVSTFP